jgi:phytoene synthase
MMCHVMGVRRPEALTHAAHLGLAMQLTNIARDVAEDWSRGRLYLPDALLARHGAGGLHRQLGEPWPAHATTGVAGAVGELLAIADGYYRSGAAGLSALSPRCALAVDAARLIYADIGRAVREQGCDPRAGRAFVSTPRKLWLLARAGLRALARLPRAWRAPVPASPAHILRLQAALAFPGGRP